MFCCCNVITTAWKKFKYKVISGSYFPVFGLNTEFTRQISEFSPNTGKNGQKITPYLDTFHAVYILILRRIETDSHSWKP